MGLFKTSNTEKVVQRDIGAATANRDRLSTQLADTEQAIARHAAAAKQAALAGNEAELDRAEVALRTAQDRSKTLKAALADVEQDLAALERTKTEIADRKVRAQSAAEIELVVRNMVEIATEYDAAAARLSKYTVRAAELLWEARGLNDFVNVGRAQVPPAVELVGQMLRAYADDVIAGKAPATLPRPEEPVPSQASEPAPKPQGVAKIVPDATSNPVLVAANSQPLDRGPDRILKVTP